MPFLRFIQQPSFRIVLLAICIGLGLLPFLALCLYNQPYLDDFSVSSDALTYGVWGAQRYLFQHWSGRYFTNLLIFVANPLSYRWLEGVQLAAAVSQLLRILVLYVAIRSLTKKSLRHAEAALLAAGLALLYIALVPYKFSALYYLTEILVYHVPAWLLVLVPLTVERLHHTSRKSTRLMWSITAVVGTLAAAGSNELTLILLGIVLSAGASLSAYRRQWFSFRIWTGLGVVLLVSGTFSVLAPGNMVRQQIDGGLVPAPSVQEAIRRMILLLRCLFVEPAMLVIPMLTLLLVPIANRALLARPHGLQMPLLLGVAVLIAGVLLGTVPYALMWERVPLLPRATNILIWWWLLGWILIAWASLPAPATAIPLASSAIRLLLGLVVCITILVPSSRAYLDLRYEAPEFARQWQHRFTQLRQASWAPHQTLLLAPLPPLQNRQLLLPPDEVAPVSSYGVNTRLATWFGIDSVRVETQQ